MAKDPPNADKTWTAADLARLADLATHNTPTGLIAYRLGRSETAVCSKASDAVISLKPSNRSPYGRRSR